jgi:hypothetical protein
MRLVLLCWKLFDVSGGRSKLLYGRYLVAGLQQAGLDQMAGRTHRSYQPGGDAWLAARLGLERMREQLQRQGASRADLDEVQAALNDPTRTIIGAPIVTAWGQRPYRSRGWPHG